MWKSEAKKPARQKRVNLWKKKLNTTWIFFVGKIFLENEINLSHFFYDTCNEMPESMKEHESSCGEWTSRNEINF